MSDLCRFLLAVSKEHTTPYDKLISDVSDEFTREQQDNLDPDDEFIVNIKHFNCFVRENGFKEVNVGTVVLYLKSVLSDQINSDLSIELENAIQRQNQKMKSIKLVLETTSLALFAFSYFL